MLFRSEVIKAQMQDATSALVTYDASGTPCGPQGDPPAIYLRASEGVDVPAGADDDSSAFLSKDGEEWTVARWEETIGRKITVQDIPGDHFTVFDEENVSRIFDQPCDCGKLTTTTVVASDSVGTVEECSRTLVPVACR